MGNVIFFSVAKPIHPANTIYIDPLCRTNLRLDRDIDLTKIAIKNSDRLRPAVLGVTYSDRSKRLLRKAHSLLLLDPSWPQNFCLQIIDLNSNALSPSTTNKLRILLPGDLSFYLVSPRLVWSTSDFRKYRW